MPTRPNMRTMQMQDTIDRLCADRDELRRLLLDAYISGHRQGWEDGPSVRETMERIHNYLCNVGMDPALVAPTKRG
jgi:hypothetical protein